MNSDVLSDEIMNCYRRALTESAGLSLTGGKIIIFSFIVSLPTTLYLRIIQIGDLVSGNPSILQSPQLPALGLIPWLTWVLTATLVIAATVPIRRSLVIMTRDRLVFPIRSVLKNTVLWAVSFCLVLLLTSGFGTQHVYSIPLLAVSALPLPPVWQRLLGIIERKTQHLGTKQAQVVITLLLDLIDRVKLRNLRVRIHGRTLHIDTSTRLYPSDAQQLHTLILYLAPGIDKILLQGQPIEALETPEYGYRSLGYRRQPEVRWDAFARFIGDEGMVPVFLILMLGLVFIGLLMWNAGLFDPLTAADLEEFFNYMRQ